MEGTKWTYHNERTIATITTVIIIIISLKI